MANLISTNLKRWPKSVRYLRAVAEYYNRTGSLHELALSSVIASNLTHLIVSGYSRERICDISLLDRDLLEVLDVPIPANPLDLASFKRLREITLTAGLRDSESLRGALTALALGVPALEKVKIRGGAKDTIYTHFSQLESLVEKCKHFRKLAISDNGVSVAAAAEMFEFVRNNMPLTFGFLKISEKKAWDVGVFHRLELRPERTGIFDNAIEGLDSLMHLCYPRAIQRLKRILHVMEIYRLQHPDGNLTMWIRRLVVTHFAQVVQDPSSVHKMPVLVNLFIECIYTCLRSGVMWMQEMAKEVVQLFQKWSIQERFPFCVAASSSSVSPVRADPALLGFFEGLFAPAVVRAAMTTTTFKSDEIAFKLAKTPQFVEMLLKVDGFDADIRNAAGVPFSLYFFETPESRQCWPAITSLFAHYSARPAKLREWLFSLRSPAALQSLFHGHKNLPVVFCDCLKLIKGDESVWKEFFLCDQVLLYVFSNSGQQVMHLFHEFLLCYFRQTGKPRAKELGAEAAQEASSALWRFVLQNDEKSFFASAKSIVKHFPTLPDFVTGAAKGSVCSDSMFVLLNKFLKQMPKKSRK